MKDRIKKALQTFQTKNGIDERTVIRGFGKPDYRDEAIKLFDQLVDTFEYFAELRDKKNFNDDAINYKITELLMINDDTGPVANLRDKMIELNSYLEELDDKVIAPPVKGFKQLKDR